MRKREKPQTIAQAASDARLGADVFGWSGVDPLRVGACLRSHFSGDFGGSVPLIDAAFRNDYVLATVYGKRVRAVKKLDYEIQTTDDSAEAESQKNALKKFYDSLTVTDAVRRDENSRFSALVAHLMSAVNYGYAAAQILWSPEIIGGVATFRATIQKVSLSCFSAESSRLRIVTSVGSDGECLIPDCWVVACSPETPLCYASTILYMLRSTPLEDWAETLEKYGRPIVYGSSTADPHSAEWDNFLMFLRKLAAGATGVVSPGANVQVLPIAQGTPPHAMFLDVLDRATAALWRGGDLSTFSQGGDGNGASMQQSELSDILLSDATFIQDTIDSQLTAPFLRFVFGDSVEAKAFLSLKIDDEARNRSRREGVEKLRALGVPVSLAYAYEAFGVPPPSDGEELVPGAPAPTQGLLNERWDSGLDFADESLLAQAERNNFSALERAISDLENASDDEDFRARAKKILKDFPEIAEKVLADNSEAEALAAVLTKGVAR